MRRADLIEKQRKEKEDRLEKQRRSDAEFERMQQQKLREFEQQLDEEEKPSSLSEVITLNQSPHNSPNTHL
jgi:hypothetical protein